MENWATMGSKKDTKLVKGSVSLTLGHNHVHDFPGNQLPPVFYNWKCLHQNRFFKFISYIFN